jgi:2-hydroxychromene-2-carboxylate isomerase
MGLRIDCGDFELSCKIVFGVHKKPGHDFSELESMVPKVDEIRSNLEKTVLYQIADHIGLDEEAIKAKVKERDERDAANKEAEEKGSADMRARREGR